MIEKNNVPLNSLKIEVHCCHIKSTEGEKEVKKKPSRCKLN